MLKALKMPAGNQLRQAIVLIRRLTGCLLSFLLGRYRPRNLPTAAPAQAPLPTVPAQKRNLSKGDLLVNKKQFLAKVLAAQPAAAEALAKKTRPAVTDSSPEPESPPEPYRAATVKAYERFDPLLESLREAKAPKTKYSLDDLEKSMHEARMTGDREKEEWCKERIRLNRRKGAYKGEPLKMPEPMPEKYHPRDLLERLDSAVQTEMLRSLPESEWIKLGKTWDFVKSMDVDARAGFCKELERQVREKMLEKP